MKKVMTVLFIIAIVTLLVSCDLLYASKYIDTKQEIVSQKYGEVEFVIEEVLVYKNLKDRFSHIENIDYIEKNYGSRGSIEPELRKNLYLLFDVVKVDGDYKILVYNNVVKSNADIYKMYVLTDYFLPIDLEDLKTYVTKDLENQSLEGFQLSYIKKDSNIRNPFINGVDDISRAYYHKASEGTELLSFYDDTTGNVIVGNDNHVVYGNMIDKKIYNLPNISYHDYIRILDETLQDEKLNFSIDQGITYHKVNDKLKTFDIWGEALNTEVSTKLFIYAFTHEDFIVEVEKLRTPDFPTYIDFNDETINNLKAQYDRAYFEEHIFIFYYKMEANVSENYIYSVTKSNNTLTVNVNRFNGMATALSHWFNVITIKKEDVKDITKVDLIVRTISKPVSSVTIYIDANHMRDFYMNDLTVHDFDKLNNLKEIKLFRWSLNIDLKINHQISDDELKEIISHLEANENVLSMGYKGKDFIRLQMQYHFYDKVIDKTLTIDDLINDQALIDNYNLSFSYFDFTPIGSITFILQEEGKANANQFIADLKNANYPFIDNDSIQLDAGYYYPVH